MREAISDEVWTDNYKGPEDDTLEDTWHRQAYACSRVEKPELQDKVYKDFMWLLSDFKGIAGGRITANLGVKGRTATTLFNCFVHSPADIKIKDPDSIEGIYNLLKAQASTLKSEGGYGQNFSYIRPAGSYVKGIDGRTPGVLKFMELWDKSSEVITTGSEKIFGDRLKSEKRKIRKGAQMGILSVWHPEIEDFIDAKLVPNRLNKFNLSVGITEGFMKAVKSDSFWDLKFPNTNHINYKKDWDGDVETWEKLGYDVTVYKTVKARDLWDKIMKSTYTRNDPGILFFDLADKLNPINYCEKIVTTNACSEILMATGVCLLLSFNLVKFVLKSEEGYSFDFETFKKAVAIGTRFADNINEISTSPLQEYQDSVAQKRRIGLGVLGLGSLHYMLGIKYGSEESLDLINKIFKTKAEVELLTSANLGQEKGSFLLFDKEQHFKTLWWKTLPISKKIKRKIEDIGELRNSHQAANAPTGNMSIYADCVSGGIEPVFMNEYVRWVIVNEIDRNLLREEGFNFPNVFKGEWFETDLLESVNTGSDIILKGEFNGTKYSVDKNRGLTKSVIVKDWGYRFAENFDKETFDKYDKAGVFSTTTELSVEDHINTLKIITQYVNMNSSKTVNIPNNYSFEDFKDLYMNAYDNNIKGITSYRAGTMTAVLESVDSDDKKEETENSFYRHAPRRPSILESKTHKLKIDFGNNPITGYVTVSFFPDTKIPYEIFVAGPYQGMDEKDLQILELTARSTSMNLRHGVPIRYICEQLERTAGQYMFSLPISIAKVLRTYDKETSNNKTIEDIVEEVVEETVEKVSSNYLVRCPSCNQKTYMVEGNCGTCQTCGYNGCG